MPDIKTFDYSSLSSDDRRYLREREQQIKGLAKMSAQGIVEIGVYLIEVKERLGHGKFLEWIGSAFGWSRMTAERFMSVTEQFKLHNLCNLTIDISALYLLAQIKTPEPVRTEVIRRAKEGEAITHEHVKLLRKRFEETGRLPTKVTSLVAMAVDVEKEREREGRPPLPSPAEARRIAIETGAHTLSSRGVYEPPMSVADQKLWDADFNLACGLKEFVDWIEKAPDPAKFAALMRRRYWADWFTDADMRAATDWINECREVLCVKEDQKKKVS